VARDVVLSEARGLSPIRFLTIPWDFWLVFVVLGVLIPWRGAVRVRRLLHMPQVTAMDRLTIYASTIAFQWVLAAVVAWRCYARGLSAADLGLIVHSPVKTTLITALLLIVFGFLQYAGIRKMAAQNAPEHSHMRQISMRLMPRSMVEALAFVALATTASLCEEFLFRGFVFAVILRTASWTIAAVIGSSLLFAFAHLYQGKRGLITTFLLGLLLAASRVWAGSLLPAIAGHLLVDLMAGYLGPKYLNRPTLREAK
jgi:membrane protease YdiL (CAAX protease family)